MIERCGDRQRKCDGIEKWPLHPFIESLPVMLQVSLFLLASGLCRHMWTINTTVTYTLVGLTGLGALLYLVIVISGLSSYTCPFQTPVSLALRSLGKNLRRGTISRFARCRHALLRTCRVWNRSLRSFRHSQPPPPTLLEDVQVRRPRRWLEPEDLTKIRRENANDARCVSWILRNITDPEALDAAVRLAGTVQWFKDGTDAEPPYDVIVSNFDGCFDSDGRVYPGSADRAYYSGRAILWIRALARCKSHDFADQFRSYFHGLTTPVSGRDCDLEHLLGITLRDPFDDLFREYFDLGLLKIDPRHTPSHSQWVSNLLLHETWADETVPGSAECFIPGGGEAAISLNTLLNRLLIWCICLGSPIDEDMLRVQDKSCDISCFHPSSCSYRIPPAVS